MTSEKNSRALALLFGLLVIGTGVQCVTTKPVSSAPDQARSSGMAPPGSPFFEAPPPPLDALRRYQVPVGSSPVQGPDDARVTLVEFNAFDCEACTKASLALEELEREYGPKLRVVWKGLPNPRAPETELPHLAARAARDQGKFWEMIRRISEDPKHVDASSLEKYAVALGLDIEAWKKTMASSQAEQAIRDDLALAVQLNLVHKPWFFVNGRSLPGPAELSDLEAVIDEELAGSVPTPGRAAPGEYYSTLLQDASARLEFDPPAAGASSEECPPAAADAPKLTFPGGALVPFCRDIYLDPAMTVARAVRVARDWVEARKYLAAAIGPLAPPPLTIVCDSDACRRAFAQDSSVAVGPNRRLPGPAGRSLPRAQVLMFSPIGNFRRNLVHEMVHADMFTRAPGGRLPGWFAEGVATSIAESPQCPSRVMNAPESMRGRTSSEEWGRFANLPGQRGTAYCQARAEVEAWLRAHGRQRFFRLMEELGKGASFEQAYGPLQVH